MHISYAEEYRANQSSYDLVMDETKPKLEELQKDKKYKVVSNDWICGKINGDGPETVIKSTSGNIYIRKGKYVRNTDS